MHNLAKITMIYCGLIGYSFMASAQTTPWKAPAEADEVKNPFAPNEDANKEAKKLYNQMCSICHGDKGKGDGMAGSALNPKPADFTSEEIQAESDGALFWKLSEGRTPMAAYKGSLKEEQRWQLVNYIRTFK